MNMTQIKANLRQLPGVDTMISREEIVTLAATYGQELITHIIRDVIDHTRDEILKGNPVPSISDMGAQISSLTKIIARPSLKEVINATGIILHTNLGRARLGPKVLADIKSIITDYSNIEYNLAEGVRGHRLDHIAFLLKFITKAEDALVVNNNAAGLILALHTFAKEKEVIISRGELIEIGGSFRIPEILSASGAKMVEVGTTNKTRISDYEQAINPNTAMILKAHQSNFFIEGFTEDVAVAELSKLAVAKNLIFLYDIGSGLLRKPANLPLQNEPDVKSAIRHGADLVAFSGDKLLGGPQAGLLVGKKKYISILSQAPMMRALRVGKLTLAALLSVIRSYLDDTTLIESIPLFSMLEKSEDQLRESAIRLSEQLKNAAISCEIIKSEGQCGGGTLPNLKIPSYAILLNSHQKRQKERSQFAETLFYALHTLDTPIIGILRKGEFLLDVLTISESDFPAIAAGIQKAMAVSG
jgi:L-seryl-tRNA(Ser) seleniumtransferase